MKQGPLLDTRGSPVSFASELGRGGEGAVFDVVGRPDTVAKVYLKPQSVQHGAKLSAMAGMASPALLRIAAWPTGTLYEPSGAIAGFTMPKVGGHRPIFQLYLPKPRLQSFPKADWRFLIHAAANTARAFSTVHSTGLVIGDVNHGNLMVADDATVQMIDCDSFQVSSGSQTWFCTVGVGTHQPPEMQGLDSYAGIKRTPNHDNFGLAVLVFQLLCMARHPFAGRYLGRGEPPSIEEAIAASKYAYSRDRARTMMDAPPGSLPIGALTPELQTLFEEAFSPTARSGGRPTADRWVTALGSLAADLQVCRTNASHFYRNGHTECPWCAIELARGVTLFPIIFVPGAIGSTGMAALWQEVTKISEPPSLGQFAGTPLSNGKPSPSAVVAARKGTLLQRLAWFSLTTAMGIVEFVAPPAARALLLPAMGIAAFTIFYQTESNTKDPFQQALARVKREWAIARTAWTTPLPGQTVHDIKSELSKLKVEHDGLPPERLRRLQRLNEQKRDKQMGEHLDRHLLASAKITGIGPKSVAALASHGIDTAGDIVAANILAISGFGPATLAALLSWRHRREATFRFDPSRASSQSDTAIIERDIAMHRARLEREVAAGLLRLKAAAARVSSQQLILQGRLSELAPVYAQALADVAAVKISPTRHALLIATSMVAIVIALLSAIGTASPEGVTDMKASQPPARNQVTPPLVAAQPNTLSSTSPTPIATVITRQEPTARRLIESSSPPTSAPALTPDISVATTNRPVNDRVVVKQAANIRSSPNNTAPVLRTAPQGLTLNVFGRSAGWLQVGGDEPFGWIFSGLAEPAQ